MLFARTAVHIFQLPQKQERMGVEDAATAGRILFLALTVSS